jgi:hypothetical protein
MSPHSTKGASRANRPADIDTTKEPAKSTIATLLPTPDTGKRVALPKVQLPKIDQSSSDLSDPPDSDADDTVKDGDLSSVSIQCTCLSRRPTPLACSHGTC